MRNLIIASVVCLVGCFSNTYSVHQIGPDRFSVQSNGHDHGPKDYMETLKVAYQTCKNNKYEDYEVKGAVQDERDAIVSFRCINHQNETVAKVAQETTDTVQSFYDSAKKKINELMEKE